MGESHRRLAFWRHVWNGVAGACHGNREGVSSWRGFEEGGFSASCSRHCRALDKEADVVRSSVRGICPPLRGWVFIGGRNPALTCWATFCRCSAPCATASWMGMAWHGLEAPCPHRRRGWSLSPLAMGRSLGDRRSSAGFQRVRASAVLTHGQHPDTAPCGKRFGAAMSSSPCKRLQERRRGRRHPVPCGAVSRCAPHASASGPRGRRLSARSCCCSRRVLICAAWSRAGSDSRLERKTI